MRILAIVLASAVLTAAPAVAAREKLTGEQKLAKLLEGREAGRPVSCISQYHSVDTEIIDKTAIVYKSGSTIYVNRPRYPESLDDDDIMVTELHGNQLCNLDIVRLHDRTGFWYKGFAGLGDFVPYRKVAARN